VFKTSGLALGGNCRMSSARNGSRYEISMKSLRRQISISTGFFECGEQEITKQQLHIKLGGFPHATPKNGTPVVMHFQHMSFCSLARIAEDPLENHGHVAHQIYWVVVHYNLPWKIKIFFRTGLFLDGGLINCRRSRIFPNRERSDRFAFIHRHLRAKWLRTHIQKG